MSKKKRVKVKLSSVEVEPEKVSITEPKGDSPPKSVKRDENRIPKKNQQKRKPDLHNALLPWLFLKRHFLKG